MMIRHYVHFTAVAAICLLTACSGEELVQVPYEGSPYANERTAGFGVAYVRASMAPARGLNVKRDEDLGVQNLRAIDDMAPAAESEVVTPPAPMVETVEMPKAVEPEPVIDADKMFNKKQRK